VLIAVAEEVPTRIACCPGSAAAPPRRCQRLTGMHWRSITDALRRLEVRGLRVRIPRRFDDAGRPVFAYNGSTSRYRVPEFPPPGCLCQGCKRESDARPRATFTTSSTTPPTPAATRAPTPSARWVLSSSPRMRWVTPMTWRSAAPSTANSCRRTARAVTGMPLPRSCRSSRDTRRCSRGTWSPWARQSAPGGRRAARWLPPTCAHAPARCPSPLKESGR
jgi:hypothetical protein